MAGVLGLALALTWIGILLVLARGYQRNRGNFSLTPPTTSSSLVSNAKFATAHLPCLLFFDELDAIAEARADDPNRRGRDVLTQLLQSLENYREEHKLVVVAATNDVDALDPAVVRAGRFDRQVRIDLPDT